jgi:hypothetical protein
MLSGEFYYNSMHAVAYGEIMKLPALAYCFNGKEEYKRATGRAIDNILKKCTQRTGAPSSNHESLSPIGATCETEYCNFATYANSYEYMSMITGEPLYGDLTEKIIFNGSQGAKKKDGRASAYMSAPNQFFATRYSSRYSTHGGMEQVYAPVYFTACCATQAARVMPEYVRRMCMTDESGEIYFVCYGPSVINAGKIAFRQETEYPFSGTVKIKIEAQSPQSAALNFRIPGWCAGASLKINGEKRSGEAMPGTYYKIEKVWQDGDIIELNLPMEIKLIEVDDSGLAGNYPYALERGPLLYSLKIKEAWLPYEGAPLTKLPPDWHWYEAVPEVCSPTVGAARHYHYGGLYPWHYALPPDLLEYGGAEVTEEYTGAYPWEESPVRLRVKAGKLKYNIPHAPTSTPEPYKQKCPVSDGHEWIELVPYGCTTLRVSYFPRLEREKY